MYGVMSISINYMGRAGNQCFQWIFARLLAEKHCDMVAIEPPDFFIKLKRLDFELREERETILITDLCGKKPSDCLNENISGKDVLINGYFQDSDLYQDKDKIKSYFELPKIKNKNTEDIVINIRLQDYWLKSIRSVIDPQWYINILKGEKYRTCYIVVEPHRTNERYLNTLCKGIKKHLIVGGDSGFQFDFIRGFDRIVCSNSTFCWLAAYLSEASKIWTFKPWMRFSNSNLAYMPGATVVDGKFVDDIKLLGDRNLKEYWKR
jgi:hypothetical protein